MYLAVAVAVPLVRVSTSTVWLGLPRPGCADLLPRVWRSNPDVVRYELKLGW
jgi:hypothetical protein